MRFEEIINQGRPLAVCEIRFSDGGYEEIVLHADDLQECHARIATHLGPPLTCEDEAEMDSRVPIAKSFGGVRKGQSVFFGEKGKQGVLVLVWPWLRARRVTLKKVLL